MTQFEDGLTKVREICERNPMLDNFLATMSSTAGVRKEYIALGVMAIPFLLLLFMGGAHFIVDLVAYLYPAYASVRAIESEGTDDDTQWLTYWVIYAFFNLIEHFSDVILHWVPFYFSFKLGLLVWMMLPTQNGATFIYQAIRSRVKTTTTESGEPTASASQGVYSEAD